MEKREENMVKIRIPLPPNDASGGEAEWVWADPVGEDLYVLRNVPTFVYGLSNGDTLRAKLEDNVLVFQGVVQRGGHSTYRAYPRSDRKSPRVTNLLQALKKMHCDIEPATDKIVGIDVLPEADIYEVYRLLEEAERTGVLEFEEGHCGHALNKAGVTTDPKSTN